MIKVYETNTDFLKTYEQYFLDDEIRYSLILGITKRNKGITLMISSVIEDRFIVGVLAGKNLIIAANSIEGDVYIDLVKHMESLDYPGIIGVKEYCNVYHKVYKDLTTKELNLQMDQRIYSCDKVNNYSENIGSIRLVTEKDIEYLIDWVVDFHRDIEDLPSTENARLSLEDKILNKTLYLLIVDNEIVSMAGRFRPLQETESVGLVYTPKTHRRKGYASRVVEEVTKKILEEGKTATLYTDLSNPTSNSIYMKIGYIPYCDSVMLNKE